MANIKKLELMERRLNGDIPTTTPRINSAYDYKDYLAKQGMNVDLTPNKNLGTTTPTAQTTPTTTDTGASTTPETTSVDTTNMWDRYKAQLAQSSVNQKAELAAINQKSNSYVNAYLKSLGLSGTSAGASQIAENGVNLANAYSQVNANEQQALDEQRSTNSSLMIDAYKQAIENEESSGKLEGILNNYDDESLTPGVKDYLESLTPTTSTWEGERELTLEDLESQLDDVTLGLNENQRTRVNEIINKLKNAKDGDEYRKIFNENKSIIQDVTKADSSDITNSSQSSTTKNTYKGKYQLDDNTASDKLSKSKSTKSIDVKNAKEVDFGDFNGTGEKGDTQYVWANMIINLAKQGKLPENSLIDFNVGMGNNAVYLYKDGKFSAVTGIQDSAAYASNSMKSIKERLKELTNTDYSAEVDKLANEK